MRYDKPTTKYIADLDALANNTGYSGWRRGDRIALKFVDEYHDDNVSITEVGAEIVGTVVMDYFMWCVKDDLGTSFPLWTVVEDDAIEGYRCWPPTDKYPLELFSLNEVVIPRRSGVIFVNSGDFFQVAKNFWEPPVRCDTVQEAQAIINEWLGEEFTTAVKGLKNAG